MYGIHEVCDAFDRALADYPDCHAEITNVNGLNDGVLVEEDGRFRWYLAYNDGDTFMDCTMWHYFREWDEWDVWSEGLELDFTGYGSVDDAVEDFVCRIIRPEHRDA